MIIHRGLRKTASGAGSSAHPFNAPCGPFVLLLSFLALLLTGCASVQFPPADLSAPGWRTQESSAIWQPKRDAPELVGELLVAHHPDGSQLVQFSKQGLPLVTARSATNGWWIGSSLRKSSYSGRGTATDRVPWFLVDRLPPTAPASTRWQLTTNHDGSWRLANPRSGEMLEGIP